MGVLAAGIWGVGSHVLRNVLPAFGRSNRVDLVAVHTRNSSVLAQAAELSGATGCETVEDMLEFEPLHAIYVAVPTGEHFAAGMRVIAAGKHLWCEKPLGVDGSEIADLLAAAREAGVAVREVDMFLHHPQFRRVRKLVSNRVFGSVETITARFGFPHLDQTGFRYSVGGGGSLLDAGFYPIAAFEALAGAPVQVLGAAISREPTSGLDLAGSAMVQSGDIVGFLDWGFGRAYRSEIEIWCEDAVVLATRAFAKPSDLETTIEVRTQSGEVREIAVESADHFALMIDNFAVDIGADRSAAESGIMARAAIGDSIRAATRPAD